MKYLFTVQNYLPQLSGVPVIVSGLAEGLVKRGHEVSVVTRKFNGEPENETISGVDVYRFSINHCKLFCYRAEVKKYKQFVKDFRCDVMIVECSQCETTDILLEEIKNMKDRLVVFHSHGFSGLTLRPWIRTIKPKRLLGNLYNFIRFKFYYRFLFKKCLNDFDHIIVLSEIESSYRYLKQHFRGDISVIPNFCDDNFSHPIDFDVFEKFSITKPYFINISNYEEVKNQKDLLRQFYLAKVSKKSSLILVGSKKNKYFDELLCLKAKLDRKYGSRMVHLLFGVPRRYFPTLLKNAVCFVLSSRVEAFSVSLVESLMSGLPFLSTNVGSASILPGGFIVDTVGDIHKKIDLIWELKETGKLEEYSVAGREFAKINFVKDRVVDKLEFVIESLVAKKNV